jgi:Ca2+-binding EF-hand superfamily protein
MFKSDRSETLDWIEFRDILFPIITGRYIERHIRALFDLFDTSRDGYLSLQEIAGRHSFYSITSQKETFLLRIT